MAREDHPINEVVWIPINEIQGNDYNPNSVAKNEMRLLYLSIKEDGLTQPVVVIRDDDLGMYVIVDGFHRFTTIRLNADIRESTDDKVPCVVLEKDIDQRMAATVRHNRARGKHSVQGMATMVFEMLRHGKPDEDICRELGLEVDELVRLKHVTGFSKLFAESGFKRSWTTDRMLQERKKNAG